MSKLTAAEKLLESASYGGRAKVTLNVNAAVYEAAQARARALGLPLSRIIDALLADFLSTQAQMQAPSDK